MPKKAQMCRFFTEVCNHRMPVQKKKKKKDRLCNICDSNPLTGKWIQSSVSASDLLKCFVIEKMNTFSFKSSKSVSEDDNS